VDVQIGLFDDSNHNYIEGNDVGTDAAGLKTISAPNADGASAIAMGPTFQEADPSHFPSFNYVGAYDPRTNTYEPDSRNVIGGAAATGSIDTIEDANGVTITGGTGNIVAGNNIGIGAAVLVTNNSIGGADGDDGAIDGNVKTRNLISGNWDDGVLMAGDNVTANFVKGNYIGTDITGSFSVPNSNYGVELNSIAGQTGAPSANLIGSTSIGGGNLISGNGTSAHDNVAAVGGGVALENGAAANFIQNNLIGTNSIGTQFLPNAGDGVLISSADANVVGGNSDFAENVISGNSGDGVAIVDAASNFVEKNFIGVGVDDSTRLPNRNGVVLIGANGNTIGGVQTVGNQQNSLGNVISANTLGGISFSDQANSNQVLGNMIGTDLTGKANLGNGDDGIEIADSSSNQIGDVSTSVGGNVIVNNGSEGVNIVSLGSSSDSSDASFNVLEGNLIGIGTDGKQAEGNENDGVLIFDASFNTVGLGNIISWNGDGITIAGRRSQFNLVAGSYIGTTADGKSAAPNQHSGVVIAGDAALNTIGAAGDIQRNVISGNVDNGIYIVLAGPGNAVQGNYIGTDNGGRDRLADGTQQHAGVFIENTPLATIGAAVFADGGNVRNDRKITSLYCKS
jgi:hypothetical protein